VCESKRIHTVPGEGEIGEDSRSVCLSAEGSKRKGGCGGGYVLNLCMCNSGSIVHSFTTCSIMIIKPLLGTPRILREYAE
jgi:hypothetical protein